MTDYFKHQIITYMGNKRKFLPYINELINFIAKELNYTPSIAEGFQDQVLLHGYLKHELISYM